MASGVRLCFSSPGHERFPGSRLKRPYLFQGSRSTWLRFRITPKPPTSHNNPHTIQNALTMRMTLSRSQNREIAEFANSDKRFDACRWFRGKRANRCAFTTREKSSTQQTAPLATFKLCTVFTSPQTTPSIRSEPVKIFRVAVAHEEHLSGEGSKTRKRVNTSHSEMLVPGLRRSPPRIPTAPQARSAARPLPSGRSPRSRAARQATVRSP